MIVIKPLIARFKLIDNVSFGGASKKDYLWFKKSYYGIELLTEIKIMKLKEINDEKISGPAIFLSGTDMKQAFIPGSGIKDFPLKSTRDPAWVHSKEALQV